MLSSTIFWCVLVAVDRLLNLATFALKVLIIINKKLID